MRNVAEELGKYFIDRGLSQKDVAEAMNVSTSFINAILNNRKAIGKKVADKLSNLYGLSASWLLTGEGEMLKNVTTINHNVVQGNATNSIVGDNNNVNMLRPNKYGDSPNEERKWAPVIPQSYAHMPDFDIMGHITKQMTGGNIEKLYSGTLDIDAWHYIPDSDIEDYCKGDCLGIKAYPEGKECIVPGKLYVIDTRLNGMLVRYLWKVEGGYEAATSKDGSRNSFMIADDDVIRIYRKLIMFRY